jgi:hypothetical protein
MLAWLVVTLDSNHCREGLLLQAAAAPSEISANEIANSDLHFKVILSILFQKN